MDKYEKKAREFKLHGKNCSFSIYNSFLEDLNLSGEYPLPRSIDGKCGALLSSFKILNEINHSDKIEKFEEEFINEFGYSKCIDLMKNDRRCNDYVGWCANKISKIINS